MRHGVAQRKLGRNGSHRRAMLANLVASLILEGSIETTVTRAKEVRRVAERLITRAKGGTLHDRRIVISRMNYKEAVIKLFDDVAPRFADRPGGYSACCFRHTVLSSMRRYRRNRSTSASRRRILPESGTGNRCRRPIPWRPIGKNRVRISED